MGFLFGGKTGETAESLARKRAVAEALLANANNRVPQSVGEGIASIGQALSGRLGLNVLQKQQSEGASALDKRIQGALGGGTGLPAPSGAVPMSGAGAEVSATTPGAPIDMTGNQVFSDFIDTVKTGVTNPYGLAAVAATGKAESGYSPGNVNRTWSDPSESGQPGTAGGIMSWRGPRYQALAATGDLSPKGQAKFFLNENPGLITALNSAKSVEEAQQLMNNAWAFKGYNRPGNAEAASRLSAANSFLPQFQGQGGGQPVEVASIAPQTATDAIQAVAPQSPQPAPETQPKAYVDPGVVNVGPKPGVTAALAGLPAGNAAPAPKNRAVAQALTGTQVAQAAPAAGEDAIGFNPELLTILSDPYITPAQSATVRAVIEKQLSDRAARAEEARKRADPKYQLDLKKGQLEVDALQNPKLSPGDQARIELDKSKFDYEKGKPTEVGGRLISPDGKVVYEAPGKWSKLDDGSLFNESTGEFKMAPRPEGQSGFRFKGSSVEAQSLNGLIDSGTLTEDQAQQLGAGKTVSGPNGEIIFMTPQGVFSGNGQAGTAKPLVPPQVQTQQQPQPQPYVDLFGNGGQPAAAQAPAPAPAVTQPPAAAAPSQQQAPQTAPEQRSGLIPITGPKATAEKNLTAGDRQAIREADDIVMNGAATLGLLDKAMELSPKANEGFAASTRARAGAYLPDGAVPDWVSSPDSSKATIEYDNIIKEQALGQLKAIFGGAPTEGERAILLEIQGSSSQPKEVRESILKRAKAAVQQRVAFNRDRASDLRGGTYYKPNRGADAPAVQGPAIDDLLKKYGGGQ